VTAPTAVCQHCNTKPVVRRVQTRVPGSRPVDLGLCDCDYPHCPHPGCKKIIRKLAIGVHRCPHCNGRL
jgi:hypothetical protein